MWRPDARHRRVRGGAAVRRDRHGDGDGSLSGDVEWLERPGDERIVADAVGEFLSLSDDLRPVYDAADADPAFAPVVEDLWGIPPRPVPDAVRRGAVGGARPANPEGARARQRRLAGACGRVVDRQGGTLCLTPTPERVLVDEDTLVSLFDEWTARTVLAAATTFADEALSARPTARLASRLESVWGFDAWMAGFVTLRGFGRMEHLPVGGYDLLPAVGDLYGADAATTPDDLERLGERYAPLSGYWAHYIDAWRTREDEGLVIGR